MSGSTTTITVINTQDSDNTPEQKDTPEPFSEPEPESENTPKSDNTPGKSYTAQTDLRIYRLHSKKARKCNKFQNVWPNSMFSPKFYL